MQKRGKGLTDGTSLSIIYIGKILFDIKETDDERHRALTGVPFEPIKQTLALLEKCSKYKNFVLSSGCDIPPKTPWENIDAFFAATEEYYS